MSPNFLKLEQPLRLAGTTAHESIRALTATILYEYPLCVIRNFLNFVSNEYKRVTRHDHRDYYIDKIFNDSENIHRLQDI